DHVFSRQDGMINWLADRPFGIQNIENFGHDFTGIRSLTFQARHMDRFLMQEAPKSVFKEQAKYIQEQITDTDIEKAVANMPSEIYELAGKTIEAKLKNRIRHLHEAMEEYYQLLSKEVDVTGSKKEEYFQVEHNEDGSLGVKIFDTNENAKGQTLLYDRTFFPNETREVRLWGLGNEDIFNISGEGSKIKLRAFGGPGDDIFIDNANAKTLLYDKGSKTEYRLNGGAKVVNHWNKELYEYDRTRFEYNYAMPVIYAKYSNTYGFGVNFGYNFTIRNFEKDDYHSKHSIGFGLTTEENKRAFYAGRFHQAIRKWDFLLNASADDATVRNRFFGIGNDSENLEDEFGVDYFQPKISNYQFSLGLMRDFWQKSTFIIKAGIEQNNSKQIKNTFLSDHFQDIYGAHEKLTFAPIHLALDLDFRDESGLPYKGARLLMSYENNRMLSDVVGSNNFGIAIGKIEYYLSSRKEHPVTFGFRVGGATSHGDVPWYKLPTLGTGNGLRGYVENRFTGESAVFFNTELRYQILERETSIVPIKAGIKIFYDYGRIFQDNLDESNDWRYGYGFGFYLVPLNESLTLSLSCGFSDEETIYPIFSIGTPLK
ncbi:MAG: hypothetical protein GY705_14170, partial [Bacteroidetes bacterium]|nr:hypothetical protein [Bacteroidota bacterium]